MAEHQTPAVPAVSEQPAESNAIFTCAFNGFASNSLWFTPFVSKAESLSPDFFAAALEARARTVALLAAGCELAKARHPELSAPLSALGAATPDLDFFELPERPGMLGWFRMTLSAPGATIEALRACESALAATGAPVRVAEADASTRLGAFASAVHDDAPSSFVASLREATGQLSQSFASQELALAPAEALVLQSADGSKRLLATMPSAEHAKEGLAELATFAKFAQACIEAKQAASAIPHAEAFFAPMIQALGGGKGAMAQRQPVGLPEGVFFPAPAALHATVIEGLPTESFEACAKLFLQCLAKRFGAIAASSKGLEGLPARRLEENQPAALSIVQLAQMAPLFERLPVARVAPTPKIAPTFAPS
jgi:hypothetical protein